MAKQAVLIEINGDVKDLHSAIEHDSTLKIIKKDSDSVLEVLRHDCAHVMAEAVQELFPDTQVTIGPAIDNGFYYDFARKQPFTTDDFKSIENKMHEIINKGSEFRREVWTREKAMDFFKQKGEFYKLEIIKDLPDDEELSIYFQGEWLDLCKGPHLPSTKHIGKSFNLRKVAGAYW